MVQKENFMACQKSDWLHPVWDRRDLKEGLMEGTFEWSMEAVGIAQAKAQRPGVPGILRISVRCTGRIQAQQNTKVSWSSQQALSPCHTLTIVCVSPGGCGGLVCWWRRSIWRDGKGRRKQEGKANGCGPCENWTVMRSRWSLHLYPNSGRDIWQGSTDAEII